MCGWACASPTAANQGSSVSSTSSSAAAHFALTYCAFVSFCAVQLYSPFRSPQLNSIQPSFDPTLIIPRITSRSHTQHQHSALSTQHRSCRYYSSQHHNSSRLERMCLVKVKQEEEVVVPYRVVSRHNQSPPRRRVSRQSTRRYSREIVRESRHESPRPSASYIAVPTPQAKPLAIPPPQPVPIFVEPQPAPIHIPAPPPPASHISSRHSHHGAAQYVEVSPRSSYSSRSSSPSRSEYIFREREVRRERAYSPDSPDREPQYEHYRYVEPARSESSFGGGRGYGGRERSRSRVDVDYGRRSSRSMSRGDGYRRDTTRVTIVDDDGRRRRDYRR